MTYSHLLHGIVIWGSTFKTYLGKSSVLQNKALRIIEGGNCLDNATQYYVKLNILKLDDLKCATIGFMFNTIIRHIKSLQKSKCIIHRLNGYYNSLFNTNNLTTYRRKVAVHPLLKSAFAPY